MSINTSFDYTRFFTAVPGKAHFLHRLNTTIVKDKESTLVFHNRTLYFLFTQPPLLSKLLIVCLLKNIELLIKDKTISSQITTFLVHFDKFNPIVKDREILIFLSLILNTQNIKDASDAYFQINKRCCIRDYWQFIVEEDFDTAEETLNIIDMTDIRCLIYSGFIFPYFSRCTMEHPLKDYGFDPNDGIWKSLPYHDLECQKGNLLDNYNLKTGLILKIEPKEGLYKYLNGENNWLIQQFEASILATDDSQSLFLVAIPPALSSLLLRTYKHIYNFAIGPKHFTPENYIVGLSPEAQDLIIRLLDHEDKDQKDSFNVFLKSYNPSLEDFKPIN
jgi:hypothetical protein